MSCRQNHMFTNSKTNNVVKWKVGGRFSVHLHKQTRIRDLMCAKKILEIVFFLRPRCEPIPGNLIPQAMARKRRWCKKKKGLVRPCAFVYLRSPPSQMLFCDTNLLWCKSQSDARNLKKLSHNSSLPSHVVCQVAAKMLT